MKNCRFACLLVSLTGLMMMPAGLYAQADKSEVRAGNRDFKKSNYKEAEIQYRKALVKDSTSFAASYDLASALYKQKDSEGAGKILDGIKEQARESQYASRYHFNAGDVALEKQDYASAVEAFKQCLLLTPEDLEAKQNYIFAKKKLEQQQNQNQQQNQDRQEQDKQEQQQEPQPDEPQPQDDQQQESRPSESQVSPQQAQQMLQAIQAKEKETQDKVEKKKAEALKTRQKDKNW